MATKLDSRQIISRDLLAQLYPQSSNQELDNLLRSINFDLSPPLRMDASQPNDLVVSIESGITSNSESGRKKSLGFVNSLIPDFTSGTVTFPASSGGTITVSPGANNTLTVSSNEYVKILIYLTSAGTLAVSVGASAASEALAIVPAPTANTLPIGYVTIFNNAGTIENVAQSNIYQFTDTTGVSAAGGGSADEYIQTAFKAIIEKADKLTPVNGAPGAGEFRSEITNRVTIEDKSNELGAIAGIERITFNSLDLVLSEVGPNGEFVNELNSKDDRIRFVGNWTVGPGASPYGNIIQNSVINEFIEVIFYGTGINLLQGFIHTTPDIRVTIDGGTESANIIPASGSNVIAARSYRSNMVLPLASGLTLGWHTIKIRSNGGVGNIFAQGVEILNDRTDLRILPGSMFAGATKQTLVSASDVVFTPAGMTGGKGGRVKSYLDNVGTVQQVFTEVDATQLNLGSTDHSNEELIRRLNYRSFGANRGDDFSTLSGSSDRAFTLDDGTTTLVARAALADGGSIPGFRISSASTAFFTLTFVGTGLDLSFQDSGTGTEPVDVIINNSTVGTISSGDLVNGKVGTISIVSGLPYGTHVVKLLRTATGNTANRYYNDFIIYGPKEPLVPIDGVEICDYNVMADFAANTISGETTRATGILRKDTSRELLYTGSNWGISSIITDRIGGKTVELSGGGNPNSMTYTFYGTGFELRARRAGGRSNDTDVIVDGLQLTTTNYPGVTTSTYDLTFTGATGKLSFDGATQANAGFRASGLTLGVHTVEFRNNTSTVIELHCLDIITPIHINKSGLKTGSLSLADTRNFEASPKSLNIPVDLSKAKAWLVYDQTANRIISSYNIAAVLDITTGRHQVYWETPFKNTPVINICGNGDEHRVVDVTSSFRDQLRFKVEIKAGNSGGTAFDASYIALAAFGELEGEDE